MIWLALPALAATAYYLLAIVAALRWPRAARRSSAPPPVSLLKPVRGRDPRFWEAIRSCAAQEYPEFEIVFGVTDPADPACRDIERLAGEFPGLAIRTYVVSTKAANAKVGVLAVLAREARHELLLVSDSDIEVGPGYLRDVTAPLADPAVGLVTCLYRGRAGSWASRAEALGIATEFAPSVLVARLLGQVEFALGSTMVFRRETLAEIGGFEAIADFIADDYQLGCRIRRLGLRIEFAPAVVETDLVGESWHETWRHQVRWSRTIRVSRPAGYFGYVVTHATFWALVAFAAGAWWAGMLALGVRTIAGLLVGSAILEDRKVVPFFWLIPLRDLLGVAVWLAGLFGTRVEWRGRTLRLTRDGRIEPAA